MDNVKINYLKDANGNVISPVVSTDSVFDINGISLTTSLGNIEALLDTINGEVV